MKRVTPTQRVNAALVIALGYKGVEGTYEKWIIDQIIQRLTGEPKEERDAADKG